MPHMALSRRSRGYRDAEIDEYDPTIEDSYGEEFCAVNYQLRSSSMKMTKGRLRRSSISPPPSPPALNIEVAQVIEGY